MKRIVVLISGRGSNMEALVQACALERWPARVEAVISNRPLAAGLGFARSRGIAAAVVDHQAYADRVAFDRDLARAIGWCSPGSCGCWARISCATTKGAC
jgi:phosphoribosylglycinamide formyltransferase-1